MNETTTPEPGTDPGVGVDADVRLRAWCVFSGEPIDGCLLVYACTRNDARKVGMSKGPGEWGDYIDVSARRAPEFDQYAIGGIGGRPYIIMDNDELPDGAELFYIEGAI